MPFWKFIAVCICSGLLLALVGYLYYYVAEVDGQPSVIGGPPPAVVTATTAKQLIWRSRLDTVGTIKAIQGIDVTTEIVGKVAEINFSAGTQVEAGELLVKLDTSTERAELRALEARLGKARSDEKRARQLVDRGFISKASLQQTTTERKNLQAQVEQQRAVIKKKSITAPFKGKLGIRQISTGELISPGSPIVTLQSISPIFVNFTLPEHTFSKVAPGQNVEVSVAAYPNRIFNGEISAINPKISEQTRNFTAQALLSNSEGRLQPGMFADVTISLGSTRQVIAVPVSAVAFSAYGEYVFFVRNTSSQLNKSDSAMPVTQLLSGEAPGNVSRTKRNTPVMVADRSFIKTGERRGLMIEVVKGVKAGDRIVTAGQIKIEDGFPIIISDDDILKNIDATPIEP